MRHSFEAIVSLYFRYNIMMKHILLSFCVFGVMQLYAQSAENKYPKNYFRNPLDIPIFLAGNFGECRLGHFHSGLDIKTGGKENLPVHAAADGYISRVKLEKGGFGHAIYITHPNGYTTLYAHLNDFVPELQHYLRTQQYKQQTWAIDLSFTPTQFPVKKGDQIAFSGNTGASTAPHLHFEIRDSRTEHPLNGGLFGLPITDNKPPVMHKLAVYNMETSIYEQTAHLVPLTKKGDAYRVAKDTLVVHAKKVGFGINADDFMEGSDNTLGFYEAALFLDKNMQCEVQLDNIGYDETRYLHAFADYKTMWQTNTWVEDLFQLPGNNLGRIYGSMNAQKGVITLEDDNTHAVMIEVKDVFGNESAARFYIRNASALPDTAAEYDALFAVGKVNKFEKDGIAFTLDKEDLYDDVHFKLKMKVDPKSFSERYQLHYPYVPVHTSFELRIKPDKPIPFALRNKIAMVYNDGKDDAGKVATRDNDGWYKASVRDLGEFRLVADTTSPEIVSENGKSSDLSKAAHITFKITDDITSVRNFKAELDGKWLLFEPHGNLFFYKFDEHCSKGHHTLRITVTDENGNPASMNYTFTR